MAPMIDGCGPLDPALLCEPSLDELLSEPIVMLFMERDHVSAKDMRDQIDGLLSKHTLARA